ncbi:restriction endonuclease subunit S [Planctomycetaceae bacterium]|nr:restriction endonuclease subunit S [Planctomycetaceae bacterium]
MSHLAKLGDLVKVQSGFAFKSKEYSDDGHFLIRISNVQDGFISLDKPKFVQLDEKTSRFELREGDVLVSLTGNIGRAARIEHHHLPAALNQRVARLSVKEKNRISDDYLFWFLSTAEFRDQLSKVGRGVAQQNVSPSAINDAHIYLPPLPEQKRIVAILDEAFGAIAKAKENAQKNLANARELFESYLNRVFTEKGEGWGEKTLGDVCTTTQGVQIQKTKQHLEVGENRRRYLYISDFLHDRNLKYVDDIHPKKLVTPDDLIVVNTGNTAGTIFRGVDGILSNNLFRVSFDSQNLDSTFLYYFVTSPPFVDHQKAIVRGTANPHMGHQNFKSTPFATPHINVQKQLAFKFEQMQEYADALKSTCNQRITALDELKQSILQKAFTGQLTAKSPELEAVP